MHDLPEYEVVRAKLEELEVAYKNKQAEGDSQASS